jgi:uncharacterized membrane protein HdeD (DUF308 family)
MGLNTCCVARYDVTDTIRINLGGTSMKMKKTLAAVVAASLIGTPVVAQGAAVQGARTSSSVEDAENIQGGWFIPLLAALAIILGIVVLVDGGDDLPTSP